MEKFIDESNLLAFCRNLVHINLSCLQKNLSAKLECQCRKKPNGMKDINDHW